jgi:hypothetical protein
MSDIVERLRRVAKELPQTSGNRAWLKPEDTTAWEAADEIEKLRAALRLAIDAVEHWASYASLYAQEKHDLAGDLQKLRAALGEKE